MIVCDVNCVMEYEPDERVAIETLTGAFLSSRSLGLSDVSATEHHRDFAGTIEERSAAY